MKIAPAAFLGASLVWCGCRVEPNPTEVAEELTMAPRDTASSGEEESSGSSAPSDSTGTGSTTRGTTDASPTEAGVDSTSTTAGTTGGSSNSGDNTTSGGAEAESSGEATDEGLAPGAELPLVYDEEHTGADCPLPTLPAADALATTIRALPDPFTQASGERMTRRSDWRCRRAEIAQMIETYELGSKPAPPTDLTATYAEGMLTVTVTVDGNAITLSTSIATPSGAGPFPAVIGMDGATGSIPAHLFTDRGIATMAFRSAQLTPQAPNRGQGEIYRLYPDPEVGSMILWAWGVSRIIDGLVQTAGRHAIDLTRLAVTGCSYAGKMALYSGAFDERIALTIVQESGGGGEAAWRVSAARPETEDLEHAQGTAWYHQGLTRFDNTNVGLLPFDQHELAALVAPRALLTLGNPDIQYLSTEAGYVAMKAAEEVYGALGVADRLGFSQVGGHGHCTLPESQFGDVGAFLDKFLLGMQDADTNIAKTPYDTDLGEWIDWTTPDLE